MRGLLSPLDVRFLIFVYTCNRRLALFGTDAADSYLGPILYLMDGKLHRNVEAVQDVSPKHQSVLRSVDSVDPALV